MTVTGAKLALFLGDDLVSLLRDDRPDIPFPDMWDLPGGGCDPGEDPATCVLRETVEEVGLRIDPARLVAVRDYEIAVGRGRFFAAHLPAALARSLRLGDEGQRLALMPPRRYCAHPRAIPHLAGLVAGYCEDFDP